MDPFSEQIEQVEVKHNLRWNFGMRDQFLRDIKRDLENVNGRFRIRSNGASVDIENYLNQKLHQGIYVKTRPGVKEKYVSPYKSRDEGTKKAHAQFTRTFLIKALNHEGIKFKPGYLDKAIEFISNNFLVGDDSEKGTVFHKANDTEIGFIAGRQSYDLNGLLNHLSMAAWVDHEATELAQLQHRAALRQTASTMVKAGAKPAEIEALTDKLHQFEKRELRTGKRVPLLPKEHVEAEYRKFNELNGQRPSGPSTSVNKVDKWDDLGELKSETRKFVVSESPTPHEGI